MENQAPQMTPEMYAELQGQQGQPAPVEPQAPAQPDPQQIQQQPAPATPPEDASFAHSSKCFLLSSITKSQRANSFL